MKFANTNRTDNGEGKPLCTCILHELTFYGVNNNKKNTITDVEGRRLRE